MSSDVSAETDGADGGALVSPTRRAQLAVFTSGISSMGIEVLAGRIIAPVYGNSVYTWGGVLGVSMSALALGYWIAGRRAETSASISSLAQVLVWASLIVGAVAVLDEVVVETSTTIPLPHIYAPIIPLLVLFGPPTFVLGFISPYAAELTEANSTGQASGRVYSLGTIGSIVGAFLTTYVLIPYLSVLWIEALLAVILAVVGILIAFPPSLRTVMHAVVAMVVVGAAVTTTPLATNTGGDVVYETETPYQHLKVADDNGIRTMYLNGHEQSAMNLSNETEYVWEYPRYAHLDHLYRQNATPERVLVIGAAGFSVPKRYLAEYPNVTVDVVDVDGEVVNAGEKYFNVSESPRLNVHVADARRYLRNTDTTYDAIFLDAFQKNSIPFHLTTVQFMQLASRHLDSQGVFIENMISASVGPRSKFARSEFKTTQSVFPSVDFYPTAGASRSIQNVMVVATKGEDMTPAKLRRRNRHRAIGIDLSTEIGHYKPPNRVKTAGVPVLRDGNAPVDRLTQPLYDSPYVIQGDTRNTSSS